MARGVEPVGAELLDSGEVEHLGQHSERAVDLIGRLAHVVMRCSDIDPLNLRHAQLSAPGVDEELLGAAVFRRRARLAMVGDILL